MLIEACLDEHNCPKMSLFNILRASVDTVYQPDSATSVTMVWKRRNHLPL
jgi:hypothetical protein